MIEILKIIYIFSIFLIFISSPLNIFNKSDKQINISFLNYNLIINFNILLILSLISIPIKNYQLIYLLILILFFSYSLSISKIQLKDLKKMNFINFLIFYFSFIVLAISVSSNINLGWDAKYFYYIKSLFFYQEKTIFELNIFEPSMWHPHFGSYLWSFFWTLRFVDCEHFGRFFYLFLFCYSFFFVSILDRKQLINNTRAINMPTGIENNNVVIGSTD